MAVVDRIFEYSRTSPERLALIANGRPIRYGQFAAMVAAARQAIGEPRSTQAVICIADILTVWTYGLALRSLGVTTLTARSADDIERLPAGPALVLRSSRETGSWAGLESGARRRAASVFTVDGPPIAGDGADFGGAMRGAHILMTSGTTGDHKKVLIDAAAERVVAASNAEIAGLSETTRFNVFDFGGWTAAGYFWPLAVWSVGGTVIIDQGREAWRSLAADAPMRPTVAVSTPFLASNLLAAPDDVVLFDRDLTLLVVGGPLSAAQWRAARQRLTPNLRSMYGATETWLITSTPLTAEADLTRHHVNPQCEVQIVDEHERPLGPGVTGRVRMRPTRVDGYLDAPQASAAFFRDGFFYPGDLGRLDDEGRLSLQGRITDVINVLGDKIGVLPMETQLQDSLGAAAVCVFSAPGAGGEAVHVALQRGRNVTAEELRAALLSALPSGVSGVHVHAVEAMPRNHMGKIDRAELMRQLLK